MSCTGGLKTVLAPELAVREAGVNPLGALNARRVEKWRTFVCPGQSVRCPRRAIDQSVAALD